MPFSWVNAGSRRLALGLASGATLAVTATASAHHSFSMFDTQHPVQVVGIVKSWQFTNPHSWLQLVVLKGGQPILYSVECGTPVMLIRRGWSNSSFNAGDKVTVVVNPLKSGANGGSLVKAVIANGQTLTE
jgi:hypothetical protein